MKNKWLLYLLLGGAAYYLTVVLATRKSPATPAPTPKLKVPLPPASVLTGRTQVTTNNRPPNYPNETVGYGKRTWAEYKLPDGRTDWVEVEG